MGYMGVVKKPNGYEAYAWRSTQMFYLGTYRTSHEAAVAHDVARVQLNQTPINNRSNAYLLRINRLVTLGQAGPTCIRAVALEFFCSARFRDVPFTEMGDDEFASFCLFTQEWGV
jgi:hypothetical protein